MTLLRDRTSEPLKLAASALGLDHLWGWEPDIKPDPGDPHWQAARLADDKVVIGYLAHDDSPSDYWEFDRNGLFKEFRDAYERDEWMEARRAEGLTVFLVDKYAHGNVHYSIANTSDYPDRRWDVSPCAALACDFESWGTPPELQAKCANDILDQYSKWCNGEVYGAVTVTLTIDRTTGEVVGEDTDSVWGAIGDDWALELLAEQMP